MAFTVADAISNEDTIADSYSSWKQNYKDTHIQKVHDSSQMDVVLPDDCLLLAGPPRFAGSSTEVVPIGFVTSFQMQESRQVQPMKAIGSRRHVFTATNAPVTLSMERMLIDGPNLMASLYGDWDYEKFNNEKYIESAWFMNLEDDIYRIPFGLGVIYHTPRTLSGANSSGNTMVAPGADYFEGCVIQSCSMGIQQGQTAIMENVQILCDRRVPYKGNIRFDSTAMSSGSTISSSISSLLKSLGL